MAKKDYNKKKNNYKAKGNDRGANSASTRYESPKEHDKFQGRMRTLSPDSYKTNDIAWHNKAPSYVEATRVPFNVIPGRPKNAVVPNQPNLYDFQGITSIEFVPSIGYANGINDPVNRAFNMIYAQMASKTAGNLLNMQQADLAFVTIGGSSIAAGLGYAKAIMELANTYAPSNMYFPKLVLEHLGFEHNEIVDNAPQYRSKLNDLIRRFNNLCIPNFTNIFVYHYMLARNVFTDEDDQKAQVFKFVPHGYYQWDDTGNELKYKPFTYDWAGTSTSFTFDTFLNQIRAALEAWENSSIISLVKGNIQRFYTESEMFKIDYISEGDYIIPTVDRNINWQINNMIIHQVSALNITQDVAGNNLKFTPSWVFDSEREAQAAQLLSWPLNAYDGDTSAEFIMEATRMLPQISGSYTKIGDKWYIPLRSVCNIIPNYMRISSVVLQDGVYYITSSGYTDNVIPMEQATNALSIKNLNNISKFKVAPRVLLVSKDGNYNNWTITGDINKFTYINQDALNGLAESDLQSMYWID